MGAKQWIHMYIWRETIDTGYSKSQGEARSGVMVEKLPIGCNVYYLGDGHTRSPNLTISNIFM